MPGNNPVLEQLVLKYFRHGTHTPGEMDHWQLEPQSIHLALLRSLTFDFQFQFSRIDPSLR